MYIFICIYVFQKYQYIEYVCIFFFDDILSVGFAQSASCRIEMNSLLQVAPLKDVMTTGLSFKSFAGEIRNIRRFRVNTQARF